MLIGSTVPGVLIGVFIGAHLFFSGSPESAYQTTASIARTADSSVIQRSGQRSWSGKSFPGFGIRYRVVPDEPILAKKVESSESERPEATQGDIMDDLLDEIPIYRYQIPTMILEKPVIVGDQRRPPSVKTKTSLEGVLVDNVTILISIDSTGRIIPPPQMRASKPLSTM